MNRYTNLFLNVKKNKLINAQGKIRTQKIIHLNNVTFRTKLTQPFMKILSYFEEKAPNDQPKNLKL